MMEYRWASTIKPVSGSGFHPVVRRGGDGISQQQWCGAQAWLFNSTCSANRRRNRPGESPYCRLNALMKLGIDA